MLTTIKEEIKVQSIGSLIVGSLLLIFCIFFLWNLLAWFFSIEKTVLASIIAGIFAVFSLSFTYWKEKEKSYKEAHREKKIEIYSKFINIMFDLLKNQKRENISEENSVNEAAEKWEDMNRGILLYSSPIVLKAFSEFSIVTSNDKKPITIMRATGKIILAIREDIGLSNKGLDELSVHQLYINDDIKKMEMLQ